MRKLPWTLLALVAMAGVIGCGDDDGGEPPDASVPDSSVPTDSGMTPDTGAEEDAGTDAGSEPSECPVGECDLANPSESCENAGDACYFAATGPEEDPAPLCAPAGTGADGDACPEGECAEGFVCDGGQCRATCETVNDCQEGYTCGSGVCRKLCCGGSDALCPVGQSCLVNLIDDEGQPLGVGFCLTPSDCSLIDQDCPVDGDGCYPVGAGGAKLCSAPSADGGQGDACDDAAGCSPGFVCTGSAGCAAVCGTGAEGPECEGELVCAGLTGYPGVGVCVTES